ncbi:MAG: glycosyltransferase family 9 protein [Fusobacteriaceae bacterium]
MEKKYYLKKFYIRESLHLYGIRFIFFFFKWKFKKNNDKILIKCSDGIGDLLIRTALVEKILEKYGREKVVFILNENYLEIGKMLNYNCIGLSKKEIESFFLRLKKSYILNSMGFQKYINLEFTSDIMVGNLFIPERIGIRDESDNVKRCNKYYTSSYEIARDTHYVLDTVFKMSKSILGEQIKKEEIIPNLESLYKEKVELGITIAMGTSSRMRVCSPVIMIKYIKKIIELYPEERIYLLGNGKYQKDYSKKIIESIKNKNIISLVDKTTILGAFDYIAKSKLFIGFDSGLYNFSFVIKKKTIALFQNDEKIGFYHEVPWVKILTSKMENKQNKILDDKLYPNKHMNLISVEDFERSIKLMLR